QLRAGGEADLRDGRRLALEQSAQQQRHPEHDHGQEDQREQQVGGDGAVVAPGGQDLLASDVPDAVPPHAGTSRETSPVSVRATRRKTASSRFWAPASAVSSSTVPSAILRPW